MLRLGRILYGKGFAGVRKGLYKDNGKEIGSYYLGFRVYLWLARNEGMETKMESTIPSYNIGATIRIHSFTPS